MQQQKLRRWMLRERRINSKKRTILCTADP